MSYYREALVDEPPAREGCGETAPIARQRRESTYRLRLSRGPTVQAPLSLQLSLAQVMANPPNVDDQFYPLDERLPQSGLCGAR